MTSSTAADSLPWAPVEALGVFMDLLAQVESATPASSEFYDRLCEATCRLAHLRRAVIFLWDDERRQVLAAGSRGVELEVFAGVRIRLGSVPIARAALVGDCVVEAHERFEEQIPADLVALLRPRNLVCTPMSAGGRWFGILMAEREQDARLSDPERHTLWTLGKVAALAACARIATRQQEVARTLGERISFARDLHESVVQRLFGVRMALSGEGDLPSAERRRCLEEVDAGVGELRAAVERPLAPLAPPVEGTLAEVLERLPAERPDLGLRVLWEPGATVPTRFEPLAQHVLGEAVRNARKHARPTAIDVAVAHEGDALILQVANDGARPGRGASGMGLRLAALDAVHQGALVDFGADGPSRWRVRLVMPVREP